MKARTWLASVLSMILVAATSVVPGAAAAPKYDINTLAGKVASLNGTAGLQIRMSAFLEAEAEEGGANLAPPAAPITPNIVLSSPLDGNSVAAPDVTVNVDTAGAPQNETAVAVDPNNPMRIVAGANDYASRAWTCTVDGVPCSGLGDGYSGTYFSNDGGGTWCCGNSGPNDLGTLIPGVNKLGGGQYDAAGDPSLAFDSQGNVYYAGLGFDRTAPPNTVAVNKGTFDGSGQLTWGPPVFINQTTSPSTLNDKEWINADTNPSSPYRDRVYVSWTRFIFNAHNGAYTQSPIFFVYSSDGGASFSSPAQISGNVKYDQGSRPIVGPNGEVYVIFDGATRLSTLDATYVVKSTDGGKSFGKPVKIADLQEAIPLANTVFRNDSFPAGAAAPNGDLYVAWTSLLQDSDLSLCPTETTNGCHNVTVYSKSTDGGATWSAPAPIFPALDASTQTVDGYPVTNPDSTTLDAPATARRVDTQWPGVAIAPDGTVYMSAYGADVISPWQTCASGPVPPVGRIACDTLGNYIHNARLDYYVVNMTSNNVQQASTHPINTRNGFGGGFMGDYTALAVGSDNVVHALWTDTNNKQTVVWFYGFEFTPTAINQEDVVMWSGMVP
jgi:hypothetical protein